MALEGIGSASAHKLARAESSSIRNAEPGPKEGARSVGGRIATFFGKVADKLLSTFKSLASSLNSAKAPQKDPPPSFQQGSVSQIRTLKDLLTAPSGSGESNETRSADAGQTSPHSISVYEPHGTGVRWTDPKTSPEFNQHIVNSPEAEQKTPESVTLTVAEKAQMVEELSNSPLWKSMAQFSTTNETPRYALEGLLKKSDFNEVMKKFNLTTSEAVALRYYTTEAYKPINEAFREGKVTESVRKFGEEFNSALAKLPVPDNRVVFRYLNLKCPPETLRIILDPGTTKEYAGILSTTAISGDINKGVGAFRGRASMVIEVDQDTKARDIVWFSAHPRERELAFPIGTQLTTLHGVEYGVEKFGRTEPHFRFCLKEHNPSTDAWNDDMKRHGVALLKFMEQPIHEEITQLHLAKMTSADAEP